MAPFISSMVTLLASVIGPFMKYVPAGTMILTPRFSVALAIALANALRQSRLPSPLAPQRVMSIVYSGTAAPVILLKILSLR